MAARMGFHYALALTLLVALVRDAESKALPGEDLSSVEIGPKNCLCPHTREFSLVCGTDGLTYWNNSILECTKSCDHKPDLKVAKRGHC